MTSYLDKHNKDITLERIEPWEAERVLGVRIPMSGGMKHEYAYRKKQLSTLSKRVYNAPFDPQDAFMVYSCRYRPMIVFLLPVTTFTENQCAALQKPFIHKLLQNWD
jgi:hypothetical protein